jgi:hypothetical protein
MEFETVGTDLPTVFLFRKMRAPLPKGEDGHKTNSIKRDRKISDRKMTKGDGWPEHSSRQGTAEIAEDAEK